MLLQSSRAAPTGRATSRKPCPSGRACRVRSSVRVHAVVSPPPSYVTAANELQSLGRLSTLVPDTLALESLTPGARLAAATVSPAVLRGILSGSSLGVKPYENAINAALAAGRSGGASPLAAASSPLDRAMVNVGAMMCDAVWGRVETQIDPNNANDEAAMVAKVRSLVGLYDALKVPRERLIFGLPATWAGTQATRTLEAEGITVSLYMVFSAIQGIAAMQAGASVLRVNVGRVREWHDKNPGVLINQYGPREAALERADPGLELCKQLYVYGRRFHPKSSIMAMGLRTRQDALSLAGLDYLVLPGRVMAQLADVPTDQGYNDGLSAVSGSTGVQAALSPELAQAADVAQVPPVTEAVWREELGPLASDLLGAMLRVRIADVAELDKLLAGRISGTD